MYVLNYTGNFFLICSKVKQYGVIKVHYALKILFLVMIITL